MKRSQSIAWAFGLLTIFALASWSNSQEVDPPARAALDPIQIQTRGPIHDAMAQPFGVTPEPGPAVPKEPPPPIPEDPPEQKPDLANVQWVPGYWAWDSDRQDYLWVSGVYRVPPQDRSYVPGYWTNASDGWRWVAGFWSNARRQETPYTPEPPATLETGPSDPAPNDNAVYIPGTWIWQQDRFVWRSGYWAAAQVGRIWVPPHYQWTPNGYVYVDGYYDAPGEDRGVMFAPVYFAQPLWNDPSWRYRPNYVVGFDSFLDSAFVLGGSFFFGNYYNPSYARAGYHPWYHGHGRHDPMFAHHGWQNHRGNSNWVAGVQKTYAGRTAGNIAAPPATFGQHGAFVKGKKGPAVVTPLNQFTGTSKTQFVKTTPAQVTVQQTAIQQTRQLSVDRQKLETRVAGNPVRSNSLRLNVGSNSTNVPQIINGGALPKSIGEPRSFTPSTTPNIINAPSTTVQPRTNITTPSTTVQPRTITTPSTTAPKTTITPPAPKIIQTPKVNQTPTPAPRTITPPAPKPATAPRTNIAPSTAPKVNIAPSSAPRINFTPSTPRVTPSAPRVMPSTPARIQSTTPARSAPARSAPAKSGGGGRRR